MLARFAVGAAFCRLGPGALVALCCATGLTPTIASRRPAMPVAASAAAMPEGRELPRIWRWARDRQIREVRLAPDASCIAVLTVAPPSANPPDLTIVVIDAADGRPRWESPLPRDTGWARALAAAPGCRWVVMGTAPERAERGVSTRLLTIGPSGVRTLAELNGVVESVSVSPQGDAIAAGLDYAADEVNVQLLAPDGRVRWRRAVSTYRTPQVSFSRDGGFVIVTRWFGVGVLSARDGRCAWGAPGDADSAAGDLWRSIDASDDVQWFAAHYAPMHGPQGGSTGLLRADGTAAWRRGPYWEPDAIVAPDGSFAVIAGAEMSEPSEPEAPDVRWRVIDRAGRLLAERPAGGRLLFVSANRDLIVAQDENAHALLVFDRALMIVARAPLARPVWSRAAGLVVGYGVDGARGLDTIDAYRLPRNGAPPVGAQK